MEHDKMAWIQVGEGVVENYISPYLFNLYTWKYRAAWLENEHGFQTGRRYIKNLCYDNELLQ